MDTKAFIKRQTKNALKYFNKMKIVPDEWDIIEYVASAYADATGQSFNSVVDMVADYVEAEFYDSDEA